MTVREELLHIARERIIILDGAMGSMIQTFRGFNGPRLGEDDFRGYHLRLRAQKNSLVGCNDLLSIARPDIISGIHRAYLQAGADIIETCSFNSTAVSLADYGLADMAYETSRAAAVLARREADSYSRVSKRRFVAGSMGPTSKSASLSPDPGDPGKRGVGWDELEAAYYDNARGLLDGGAEIFLIETIFDTLNAKAAIFACKRLCEERGIDVPVMLSATLASSGGAEGGRLLSAQTAETFLVSTAHADPLSVGLNCSFGAEKLKAGVALIAGRAPCLVSAYPNAGMPDSLGNYGETPEKMAAAAELYMKEGLVNIIGGCCGTTPAHIAAIARKAALYAPRPFGKAAPEGSSYAGLEPLYVDGGAAEKGFAAVGERCNASGSRKFLNLIRKKDYQSAAEIARSMAASGADIIDVCMDDSLVNAPEAMTAFLNRALADPETARLPVMADSSRWEAVEAALKCLQGKGIVNSLSLKEGEEAFVKKVRLARSYGAAVVVMLFDEKGQADSYARKIEVAARSFALLRGAGIPAGDIIFDPNVLAIATGIPEHDNYALDFIRACRWIRENCPGAQISGGVSNLSFSFRGNDSIRNALHAVFLKYARGAGLSMAIVNPAALVKYDDIETELRDACEDAILNRPPPNGLTHAERLLALAEKIHSPAAKAPEADAWRQGLSAEDRLTEALIRGEGRYLAADIAEACAENAANTALALLEGPLLRGMKEVGERFGRGEVFLPQVIRSARVMKEAAAILEPRIKAEKAAGAGGASAGPVIIMATVKGDVHDIGKNIAGLVLSCNGCRVVDLGVMVPLEDILSAAVREDAAMIGLSGLISPSLDEMAKAAAEMERRGMKIPLLVGGAAASLAHTALRIAPEYSGPVVYVRDAGQGPAVVHALLDREEAPRFLAETEAAYEEARRRDLGLYTDDAEVWGITGRPIAVVPGERENRKITWPEDLIQPDEPGDSA